MKKLDTNWLTEGLVDFEYKKYILLAYMQYVNKHFDELKLYPVFTEVLDHYKNLINLKNNKINLSKQFPKELTDFEKYRLRFKELIEDDTVMNELTEIMDYAIPLFQLKLESGKNIFEEIESQLKIEPIGVLSVNSNYGYLFFQRKHSRVKIYEYEISIFYSSNHEKLRGISTRYIETLEKSPFETLESFKVSFIQKQGKNFLPATFFVDLPGKFPFIESVLPITQRKLVRYISENAA